MKSQDVLSDVPEFSFLCLPLAGSVTLDTFLNYSELRCHHLQNGANDSHLQGLFGCLSDTEPCLTYNQCPENGSYRLYFNYTSSFWLGSSSASNRLKLSHSLVPQAKVLVSVISSSLRPRGLYSPPGSSAHGVLQVRILEWVAVSYCRGSSRPGDQTLVSWLQAVSCTAGRRILYRLSHEGSPIGNLREGTYHGADSRGPMCIIWFF